MMIGEYDVVIGFRQSGAFTNKKNLKALMQDLGIERE